MMPEQGGINRSILIPSLPRLVERHTDPVAEVLGHRQFSDQWAEQAIKDIYDAVRQIRIALVSNYDYMAQRINELPEMIWLGFGVTVAAGLTNQALGNGISFNGFPAPEEGSIVAIGIKAETARSAGTLTVEPTINGSATGFTTTLDGTNTQSNTALQDQGLDKFDRGQTVGCRLTTTADYAPTGVDLDVCVGVVVARGVR